MSTRHSSPAHAAPVSRHSAMIGDVKLHYRRAGDATAGPAVVLLHGYPQTSHMWRHVLPALGVDHHVLAPDLRGLGDSGRPAAGYDVDSVAGDLHQLADDLGMGDLVVVGHDIGAWVAYAWAAAHPEQVAGLVVLESVLPGFGYEEITVDLPETQWHVLFERAPNNVAEALVTGRERLYFSQWYTGSAYDPSAIGSADVDEYLRCYSSAGALTAAFAYYRALPEHAAQNRAHGAVKLKIPVLAAGGDFGVAGLAAEKIAPYVTDLESAVVPDCGHWIAEERPEWLVSRLHAFVASVHGTPKSGRDRPTAAGRHPQRRAATDGTGAR